MPTGQVFCLKNSVSVRYSSLTDDLTKATNSVILPNPEFEDNSHPDRYPIIPSHDFTIALVR